MFHTLKHGRPHTSFLKRLLEANPDAILIPDCSGMTSLQMICLQSYPPYLLATILEFQPNIVLTTYSLWEYVVLPWVNLCKRSKKTLHDVLSQGDAKEQWEKLLIVLKTMYVSKRSHVQDDEHHKFMELHAAIEFKIPPIVTAFMVQSYTDQVAKPLASGKLPLHVVLEQHFFNYNNVENDYENKLYLLKQLLGTYQKAASIPDQSYENELPLHTLLKRGKNITEGVKELVYAYPDALIISDKDGLFPFMIAAVNKKASIIDLNTIYFLLRENPVCFQILIRDEKKA